jgi:ribonuclease VapC
MIVVDASALVAIGDGEPDGDALLEVLTANEAVISSINYVETGIILIGRLRLRSSAQLDRWLAGLGVQILPVEDLALPALQAYLDYGKGYHPARLNLADCFAYALAKRLGVPLLYKGNDFPLTDIQTAVQPT